MYSYVTDHLISDVFQVVIRLNYLTPLSTCTHRVIIGHRHCPLPQYFTVAECIGISYLYISPGDRLIVITLCNVRALEI